MWLRHINYTQVHLNNSNHTVIKNENEGRKYKSSKDDRNMHKRSIRNSPMTPLANYHFARTIRIFFFFFSNLYTGQWRKRRLLGWAVFKCLATCRKSVCRKRKDKKPLAPFYHARSSLVLLTRKLFFFFLKENNGTLLLPSFIWYNQWQRVCVPLKERIPAAMKILNTF